MKKQKGMNDVMIFATYQPSDWKTWKNSRYSYLKKLLGIPEEKNIYWCFSANTPEQALVNSCCTEPNQPSTFILFESEHYWQIDKITWNRYVETLDKNLLSEELLNIRHPDMVEYIVTDIPENCMKLPLADVSEWNRKLLGMIGISCGSFENLQRITEHYYDTASRLQQSVKIDFVSADGTVESDKPLAFLAAMRRAFENTIFQFAVYAYLQMMSCLDYEGGEAVRLFTPSVELHMELTNMYADIGMHIAEMTDEEVYTHMKMYQKLVFATYFGHNYAPEVKGTVHPKMQCPCRSGKPYKKCCAKKKTLPDIYDVMTAKAVSGKEE